MSSEVVMMVHLCYNNEITFSYFMHISDIEGWEDIPCEGGEALRQRQEFALTAVRSQAKFWKKCLQDSIKLYAESTSIDAERRARFVSEFNEDFDRRMAENQKLEVAIQSHPEH